MSLNKVLVMGYALLIAAFFLMFTTTGNLFLIGVGAILDGMALACFVFYIFRTLRHS